MSFRIFFQLKNIRFLLYPFYCALYDNPLNKAQFYESIYLFLFFFFFNLYSLKSNCALFSRFMSNEFLLLQKIISIKKKKKKINTATLYFRARNNACYERFHSYL